jgi:hypothetical protein
MVFKRLLAKLWGSKNREPDLTPEYIETLPSADDITFYRDSKRLLQRFDEYITAAEAEVEILSIELDDCLDQQSSLEKQLKHLNKPGSWHERHLLLKLDRIQVHCNNLKQRIEIYSQNIKIYLNLISKIQDIKAMRMNGLDEPKMEMIWVDFKETLEVYKDKLMTEEVSDDAEGVTTKNLEDRLTAIKNTVLAPEPPKVPEVSKLSEATITAELVEGLIEEPEKAAQRPPLRCPDDRIATPNTQDKGGLILE